MKQLSYSTLYNLIDMLQKQIDTELNKIIINEGRLLNKQNDLKLVKQAISEKDTDLIKIKEKW